MIDLYIGLISGTSIDAIDAAILGINQGRFELLHHHSHPLPIETRRDIKKLSHSGNDEIELLGILDRRLGKLFAEAAAELLKISAIDPREISAIGSHGQTIRHRPPTVTRQQESFSLQIGDPNTIAELTGLTTVADFRRRDIAAGGEGAPLAPAFHNAVFRSANYQRAVVNIGGIANITLLNNKPVLGFDTGPGNTLMDAWIEKHKGQSYDVGGSWAATGKVQIQILNQLLQHSYLARPVPKSTGKEEFNLAMLDHYLQEGIHPADVQATLAEFTAESIACAITSDIDEIYLCGGGAANLHLVSLLESKLPGRKLGNTSELGIHSDWVEAAAFAWLASQTLANHTGSLSSVTGATGERVLGGIYPGGA